MLDFNVFDKDRNEHNLGHLIGNDTVLLCHAVYPGGEIPYYHYLEGLDCRTIVVSSTTGPYLHMTAMSHDLGIETYTDPQLSVVSELNRAWSLREDPKRLAKKLRFQVLIHQGAVVSHWIQPLRDQWNDFMSEKRFFKKFYKQFGIYGVEWLQQHNNDIGWLFDTEVPLWEYIEMGNPDFDVFFKHYRLMHNECLEREIKSLNG